MSSAFSRDPNNVAAGAGPVGDVLAPVGKDGQHPLPATGLAGPAGPRALTGAAPGSGGGAPAAGSRSARPNAIPRTNNQNASRRAAESVQSTFIDFSPSGLAGIARIRELLEMPGSAMPRGATAACRLAYSTAAETHQGGEHDAVA